MPNPSSPESFPLVVDLDGTLIRSDLLVESFFSAVGANPLVAFQVLGWVRSGKAILKKELAGIATLDVTTLPYEDLILDQLRQAKAEGRRVYLASASDSSLVKRVAEHLGLFDGWFASDGVINLSGKHKAARLIQEFGEKQFDYIGNESADLPIWEKSRRAIAIGTSPATLAKLRRLDVEVVTLDAPGRSLRAVIKLLRPHQWAKNALVGVPLLTAHLFSMDTALAALLAFLAFSACASSVYVLNDLVDIRADRGHPTKRKRPFASGTVSVLSGMLLIPALLIVAIALAALLPMQFMVALFAYYCATVAYTFSLKRKMFVDVITLAGLYTMRVIGGGAAILIPVSEWLIAFSMFIFLALALVKRYSEMALLVDRGLPDPTNRNYKATDLSIVGAFAAAAGYNAVTVFALYLSSPEVKALYKHPKWLWFACPLLIYWVSRMIMMSHRRLMDDDPVVFALKDRLSLAIVVMIGALLFIGSQA